MTSLALRMAKHLNLSVFSRSRSPFPVPALGSNALYSTSASDAPPPQDPPQQRLDFRVLHKVQNLISYKNDSCCLIMYIVEKREISRSLRLSPERVVFRLFESTIIDGGRKAILGNTGNVPDQNILRDGQNATVFTVGTPAMVDQKLLGTKDSQKPPQWHRIAVHNEYVRRGNVWSRELTIMQLRILRKTKKQKLSIKKRSMKRGIFSRENLNRLIHLKNTRKLSHFHGGLPITKMHRGRKGASYIPFLLNLETRLDVILTRLHFCETIGQARQLIRHRKVSVNGSSCDPKQPYHYTMSKDV